MVGKCNRETKRRFKLNKIILAIDSTTITTIKTQLKWAGFHDQRSAIKLHVQLDICSYMFIYAKKSRRKFKHY